MKKGNKKKILKINDNEIEIIKEILSSELQNVRIVGLETSHGSNPYIKKLLQLEKKFSF